MPAFPSESRARVPRSQKHGCEEPLKATQGYGELLLLAALQPPWGSPCRTPRPGAPWGLCPTVGDGKSGLGQSRSKEKHQGWIPRHTEPTCARSTRTDGAGSAEVGPWSSTCKHARVPGTYAPRRVLTVPRAHTRCRVSHTVLRTDTPVPSITYTMACTSPHTHAV